MSRPEHQGPPEFVYNEIEASKYTSNTRIAGIQAEMTLRALELLNLPEEKTCYLLDIGCGSGLSGEILQDQGHVWVGYDIAPSMLDIAAQRGLEGDLFLTDAGQGMNFRPGVFDGAISISVLQWLCNADKKNHYPKKRLSTFFTKLFMCLTRGARAVFQFYPENDDQVQMIMSAAMHSGFTGGLVVDYPNSRKAKKYYLCLFAGASDQPLPAPIEDETRPHQVAYSSERMKLRSKKKNRVSVKDWVKNKKDIARSKGLKTANDSKYTARKRRPRF